MLLANALEISLDGFFQSRGSDASHPVFYLFPLEAAQVGFGQTSADTASIHCRKIGKIEDRFFRRGDKAVHPAVVAVAPKQFRRDAMKSYPDADDVNFARASKRDSEMLLRNLLDSIVYPQCGPPREISLIGIGCRCHQGARFRGGTAQEPMSFFERRRESFGCKPPQCHGGGRNTQPGDLGRFPGGDPLVGRQFLIEADGLHDSITKY